MQNRFGLLVTDVMPIYMIMPRYSHNYALFYQLLDSNLFTHRKILMLLREATSEPMAPGSIFHHINLPTLSTTKKRYIRDILGRTNFFSVIHMTLL